MERCPTVRIKATTGSYPFTTINESDFDPAKHEMYVEGVVESVQFAAAYTAAPVSVAIAAVEGKKRGRK